MNTPRIAVEQLEDRAVPTVMVSMVGDRLLITGQPDGDILIEQQPGDTILVEDNNVPIATIVLASPIDHLQVNLQARGLFTELEVRLLDTPSFDDLTILTPNDPYDIVFTGNDQTLEGNLSVRTGTEDDQVFTDGAGGLTIQGNFSIDTGAGADVVAFADLDPNNAIQIDGHFYASNVNLLLVDGPSSIDGTSVITTDAAGVDNFVEFGENEAVTIGNVHFTGSSANDQFEIDNGSIVNGNVYANVLAGTDSELNEINLESGAKVLGDFIATGGPGASGFQFEDDAMVSGNLTILGGPGFNEVDLDDTFSVLGSNITIYTGPGDDDVDIEPGVIAPGAMLRIFLDAGNDTLEYEPTNPFAFRFGIFDGGFGNNTFTFGAGSSIGYPFVQRNF